MKIGILGGTFDPPHRAHLAVAEAALQQLELDEVLFMPANRNPMKEQPSAGAKHRLAMVKLAIQNHPQLAVSDLEINRGGRSYAYETLMDLMAVQPATYWFLMGSDSLKGFEQWKQPEKLLKLCRLGVVVRPPQSEHDVRTMLREDLRSSVDLIQMPPKEISSTEVRNRIARGQGPSMWVAPDVLQYIQQHHLYRG